MRIDIAKLIKLIEHSPFGTGALSEAARIHPDDLQKLIGRGEGEEKLIIKLEGILSGSFSNNDIIQKVPPTKTTEENHEATKSSVNKADTTKEEESNPTTQENTDETSSVEIPEDEKTNETLLQEYKVIAHNNSVSKLQKMVKQGNLLPDVLTKAENLRAAPRKTLLAWLKEVDS